MSQLPKGWSEATLDELLDFVIGGDWGKDPDFPDSDFESVLCIRGTEFRHWGKEKGKTSVPRKVKSSSLAKRKLAIDDILIEISGGGPEQPVGRTVLIDQQAISNANGVPLVCTNFTRLVRPSNQVNSAFLNYFLTNFYNSGEITKYQSGSNNLRNLQFKDYVKIGVPLAPLAEQNRIVEKLDEVLAQVDTIKARLDGIPAILKRFRQSLLAAAVSGKLTEEWRSINDESFDWVAHPLNALTKSISDGDHQAPPKADEGIPFLVISNVSSGKIEFEKISRWVPREYFNALKEVRIPRKGDLLYTVTGSFGIPVKVEGDDEFCFQRHIAIIKVDTEIVENEFLYYWLLSPVAFAQAESSATGTAQKTVSLTSLRGFTCQLPCKEEQKEIVRLVDQYFAFADTIEAQVKKAQARVDKLTQSILAKAFRGELVPQDPNDEPADKLLERIALARKEAEVLAKAAKKTAKK